MIKSYFFGFVGVGAGGRVVTWDVVFCPPFWTLPSLITTRVVGFFSDIVISFLSVWEL